MTFEEWGIARDNSIKFAQETIESMKKNSKDSELSKLFGNAYTDAITDEIRDYNKNIMMTLIEEDLYQVAQALNKIAKGSVKAPEATSRTAEWIKEGDNYKCSKCGEISCCKGHYCPECGAKIFVKTHDVYEEFLKEAIHDTE